MDVTPPRSGASQIPQAEADRIRKVTGQGLYTADHRFAGVVHAAFVRSPHAHARIRGIDAASAQAMPGVLRIVTGADCIEAGFRNFPVIDRVGKGLVVPFRPVLADAEVLHVGEAVAVVIAETRAQAMDAAEAVWVEYEDLPAAIGIAAALEDGAPLVHPAAAGNVCLDHQGGDAQAVVQAMQSAALVVETTIELPRLTPFTLEPRTATASFDAASGIYTLRAPHQGVNEIRRDLTAVFGLPADRFQVLTGDVGGGFGPRTSVYPEYAAILLAARLVGRPVAWRGTRSESFLTDLQGRGVRMTGRLALDAEGRFLAVDLDYVADMGAYLSPVGPFAAVHNPLQSLTGCYAIPAAHCRLRTIHTHAVPTGPYRGAGRPETALIVERLVDLAAAKRGEDPFTIRRRNALAPAAFPYTLPTGARYDSANVPALLDAAERAAALPGFGANRQSAPGKRLGLGVALFIEVSGGGGFPDEATLTLSAAAGAPRLRIETVTASTGQSHPRTFATIAGRVLGLAETEMELVASDPATALGGAGSYASRSTIAAGSAVLLAAEEIAARLRALAALRANCAAEDLHLAEGEVRRADGTVVCPIAALLAEPITATGKQPPSNAFASGCHVAEVEIDTATGVTRLLRYLAVDDAGVTIDHQAAEAQIHGGIAQGVGEVLTEESVFAPETGQMIAASLMDYGIPRADDVPGYELVECNTPSPNNPLGVKGIGEAGTTGALCAVTAAVANALGDHPLPPMPFTPGRVWKALHG